MVINLGTNDQYFIFRGQDGDDFLGGLDIAWRRLVRLVLARDRRVDGELAITKAKTFCLILPINDLDDAMAQLLLDITIERYLGEALASHG